MAEEARWARPRAMKSMFQDTILSNLPWLKPAWSETDLEGRQLNVIASQMDGMRSWGAGQSLGRGTFNIEYFCLREWAVLKASKRVFLDLGINWTRTFDGIVEDLFDCQEDKFLMNWNDFYTCFGEAMEQRPAR